IHRIRLVTSLATPACLIVNKLGIVGGVLPGITLLISGFGGACRPLNSTPLLLGNLPIFVGKKKPTELAEDIATFG
ncbi:MAG TPA: hypothetical protein V6D30_19335, partial [Leptolyngbyaceae cyanobacterium]